MKKEVRAYLFFLVGMVVVIGLYFSISAIVKNYKINSNVNDTVLESPIGKYALGDVELDKQTRELSNGDKVSQYHVSLSVKNAFDELTPEEQYNMMQTIIDPILDVGHNYDSDRFDTLTFNTTSSTYKMDFIYQKLIIDDTIEFSKNDFEKEEEKKTSTTTSTTTSIPSIDERAVYEFMDRAFEVITNYGEDYVPEVHDPQVAQLAAIKFGISISEADSIFIKFAMAEGSDY